MSAALEVQDFSLRHAGGPWVLQSVSLGVAPGECVGLVGESGSGKSTLALALARLLPLAGVETTGRLLVGGEDVLALRGPALARWRGRQVAMVFQEPMNALNPSLGIGRQLGDVIRLHTGLNGAALHHEARQWLLRLQVAQADADADAVLARYPNALSGGMRQRVLIAMALACRPRVLLADEPTTALDVEVQAQVLGLLQAQARQQGTAVLFISHDLSLVRQVCARVFVLHRGRVVESGPSAQVLASPRHAYTQALLDALPARHPPRSRLPVVDADTLTEPQP